jgi:hypothetical protein
MPAEVWRHGLKCLLVNVGTAYRRVCMIKLDIICHFGWDVCEFSAGNFVKRLVQNRVGNDASEQHPQNRIRAGAKSNSHRVLRNLTHGCPYGFLDGLSNQLLFFCSFVIRGYSRGSFYTLTKDMLSETCTQIQRHVIKQRRPTSG